MTQESIYSLNTDKPQSAPVLCPVAKTLLWPHSPESFQAKMWQKQSVAFPGGSWRLRNLLLDLGSVDVELLIESTGDLVTVWIPSGEGSLRTERLQPERAIESYKQGNSLYFQVQDTLPKMGSWLYALGSCLGIPEHFGYCSLIAVASEFTTPLHFDTNENFTIQLAGTKRWKIWHDITIKNPMHNCIAGRPVQEEFRLYAGDPRPASLGQPDLDVELQPGSILYVPRGVWHEVEAPQSSLSLNIAFPIYTWIDVVMPIIRRALIRHSLWRENAYGILHPHSSHTRNAVMDQLEAMFDRLPEDISAIKPENLRRSRSCKIVGLLYRNPLTSFAILPLEGEAPKYRVEFVHPSMGKVVETIVSSDMAILNWVMEQGKPFTISELNQQFPNHERSRISRVVDLAIRGGLVLTNSD